MLFVNLAVLRDRLASEFDVRLAVLYGSRARGDERPDSDVDLLVVIKGDSVWRRMELERILEAELGLPVQIVALDSIHKAPIFLADAIEDGRVLLDREGSWPEILADYPSIAQAADVADAALRKRAQAAIAELMADAR
jgi:predicted nucleotidyltransferase